MSFGMPAPRLEGVDALEEDLADTESSWALYKEYSSELKVSLVAQALKRSPDGPQTRGVSQLAALLPQRCTRHAGSVP